MKTVLDASVREELINRINTVTQQNTAHWGKMNVFQMIRHCNLCEDMFLGGTKIKRVFIGRLIGPMILKKVLKDDKPFRKNSPTSDVLKTPEAAGDIEQEKAAWISRIRQYDGYNNNSFVHPFFGPMSAVQIGLLAYKHADHHLRQFGA